MLTAQAPDTRSRTQDPSEHLTGIGIRALSTRASLAARISRKTMTTCGITSPLRIRCVCNLSPLRDPIPAVHSATPRLPQRRAPPYHTPTHKHTTAASDQRCAVEATMTRLPPLADNPGWNVKRSSLTLSRRQQEKRSQLHCVRWRRLVLLDADQGTHTRCTPLTPRMARPWVCALPM